MNTMSQRFSPEVQERAVRMVGGGRILLMSCKRFVDEIVYGRRLLGLRRLAEGQGVHDEHIIPRWVLKRFGLFDKKMTLPTGEFIQPEILQEDVS